MDAHPQNFWFVQIRAKSLKIRKESVGVWPKCVNTFTIWQYTLWFYKKVQNIFHWRSCFDLVLFWQCKGNLGKFGNIWAKLVLEVLWCEKIRPTWKEMWLFVFFFTFILFGLFFGQVCGNVGKYPSHPKKFACSYTCAETCWPYSHVIFLVFSFVISGFCLFIGWMLFLAEPLSSLWKYFFLVRYTVVFI